MQPFVPVEALFKGRHFDGQIIILCASWYTSFKLSLRDLVIIMADRGITLTHTTNSALGPALPAGIREALEPIRSSGRWILEGGRDIHKGCGTLGLSVSGYGQGRLDCRFLPEPQSRCERSKDFSPLCDEQHAHTDKDHSGRLCWDRIAQCGK
jgi:hypothetical protein